MSRGLHKLAVRATRLTRLCLRRRLRRVRRDRLGRFVRSVGAAVIEPRGPTTKLLAIGTFTAKGSPDQWKPLLPAEVRDTVRLYLAGKIDQWYLKQDQSGVVFMMNVTDPKEALELLGRFAFGRAG